MTRKQKKKLVRIVISASTFIILFLFDLLFDLESKFGENFWNKACYAIFYLIIYFYIGYDVLIKAIKNIISGRVFDENFLMFVATIGAICIGEFSEAVAVLLFYQVGEWFQSYAVGRARKSISSLMDIKPEFANLKNENGEFEMVDPSEVEVGSIILIKPGEKVPIDGVVVSGNSALDTRAITGESVPVEVGESDKVVSGTINLSGAIEIKTEKKYEDSTVAKILELVENSTIKKSKSENFISKFAKWYTPIVIFSAIFVFFIGGAVTGEWIMWLDRVLNFLVISCPCALVISIPLSFFVGIGVASKNGILVKGSVFLEKFSKANIFVFDKTGTLTKGNFVVTKVYPEEKIDEVLSLALVAEQNSNHLVAQSIKSAGALKDIQINNFSKDEINSFKLSEIAGEGIVAQNEKTQILCGNAKFIQKNSINTPKCEDFGTIVYVARDKELIGYIVISDEIKDESKQVISFLNNGGKTVMLTGDNEAIAKSVAEKINLLSYKSSLLPTDKVSELDEIIKSKQSGDVVCFVGDGINDAPVLIQSDIGISMGQVGSDAAIEASDIVLMHDNLKAIVTAKKIAKRTMKIVKQNIIFTLFVKFSVLLLSAIGLASMWLAIFADVGVSVIAILNAIRIKNFNDKNS